MFHLRAAERGFSYTDENSLDMRFDPSEGISAEKVVNTFKENEIADILYEYGEERESRRIANYIVRSRPIMNAARLAEIVRKAKKYSKGRIHPATQTFQALRIFVNEELKIIESFIPLSVDNLSEKGRLAIISFHSLEDRIVKWAFRALKGEGMGAIVTDKPVVPMNSKCNQSPPPRGKFEYSRRARIKYQVRFIDHDDTFFIQRSGWNPGISTSRYPTFKTTSNPSIPRNGSFISQSRAKSSGCRCRISIIPVCPSH
jgi:16S rRNA (cytosine1402-N4)-methyltransferase